jgi:hypothetical protein
MAKGTSAGASCGKGYEGSRGEGSAGIAGAYSLRGYGNSAYSAGQSSYALNSRAASYSAGNLRTSYQGASRGYETPKTRSYEGQSNNSDSLWQIPLREVKPLELIKADQNCPHGAHKIECVRCRYESRFRRAA